MITDALNEATRRQVDYDPDSLLGQLKRALIVWNNTTPGMLGNMRPEDVATNGVSARLILAPPAPAGPEQAYLFPLDHLQIARLISALLVDADTHDEDDDEESEPPFADEDLDEVCSCSGAVRPTQP